MHGSVEKSTVKLTSYEQTGENSKITLKDPPSPEEAGNAISSVLNVVPRVQGMSHEESDEDPDYATVDFSKKTSKESLDSGIGGQNPTLSRSASKDTVYSEPWDREKTEENIQKSLIDKFSNGSGALSNPFPLDTSTDDSEKSLLTNSKSDINDDAILKNKKTNRIWPRTKYAMQQKGFIIFTATAIILSTSAALVYLQDKAKFIAFFTNSPKYITIPVIALAALLAISPILFAIRQFRDTAEHKTQEKNADGILDEVLKHQPENKAIKSVRLEYNNNTHSNFIFNAWESKNDFINIDEKVISRTNKIESVINNRPLFTALLTGVVAANIAFPLLLYAEGGVNNVQKFYQNPLTNNIGLSLLIGSGVLALLVVCFGVHYYNKTNCTNLIYSQEKINTESVNKKFIEEIKQERTEVLGENHSKDAKRSSLTLEQVVVQSHNCKDVVYSVG